MKRFFLMILMTIISFGFSSCVSSQSIYEDYQKVYFDHVIYGHVISNDYIYDGTYSYHIIGAIPRNVYWELYPCGLEVYLYTKQMVRMRLFEWNRRSIYYNRTHHNYYKFDNRYKLPHKTYHYNHKPKLPDMKPNKPSYGQYNNNMHKPNIGGMRNMNQNTRGFGRQPQAHSGRR